MTLAVLPTVFGAVLIACVRLWRIDRVGIFYDYATRGG